MQAAEDAVINKEMGFHSAATVYNVPQKNLETHVRRQKEFPEQRLAITTDIPPDGRNFALSFVQEIQLVNYLSIMQRNMFVLTARDIRALAFQLVDREDPDQTFNKFEKLAGEYWRVCFQKRHPEILLKRPEETLSSVSDTSALVRVEVVEVDKFFDRLEELASRGITPDRIYNADDVMISLVQNRVKKSRGRRFSRDNGAIVTSEICFSAAGAYMPPQIVFPSEQVQAEFEEGLPGDAKVRVHPSGDFTNELYFDWFKDFVVFSKANVDSPVVLLVNGQSPFIKNLDLVDYADEHGVNILCFPPHSLGRLEPINVYFVHSLALFYGDEAKLWMHSHLGQRIPASQVSPLFGSAYKRSATRLSATAGFAKTGVWPPRRPSLNHKSPTHAGSDSDGLPQQLDVDSTNKLDSDDGMFNSVMFPLHVPVTLSRGNGPPKTFLRAGMRLASRKAALPLSARVETSQTPIFKSLTFTSTLRALYKTNDESTIEKKDCEEKKGRASCNSNSSPPSGDIRDNYDPSCLYCNDFYSNSKDGWWLSCEKCLRWAHHSCAGFDDENDQVRSHLCKMCA